MVFGSSEIVIENYSVAVAIDLDRSSFCDSKVDMQRSSIVVHNNLDCCPKMY